MARTARSTELLTTYAVAKRAGVKSTRTIRRWIQTGKLSATFNERTRPLLRARRRRRSTGTSGLVSVVVEADALRALLEPHLRAGGDKNSPLLCSSKKLAAFSPSLRGTDSAYRYLSRLRAREMTSVKAERADETLLALLGEAAHQLRSLPHFFDTLPSAMQAAEAYYADEPDATRTEARRLANSLLHFSLGWKRELLEQRQAEELVAA
jgi:hypothetical protein